VEQTRHPTDKIKMNTATEKKDQKVGIINIDFDIE
jgi:hypothetical protein